MAGAHPQASRRRTYLREGLGFSRKHPTRRSGKRLELQRVYEQRVAQSSVWNAMGKRETRKARNRVLLVVRKPACDTQGHNIQGVQQQQQSGMPGALQFTSQNGTFGISTLPILSPDRKVGEASAF